MGTGTKPLIVNGQIRGCKEFNGTIELGDNVTFGGHVIIARGKEGQTTIGNNVSIGNFANIGHNVTIGHNVEIGAGVIICGYAVIEEGCKIKAGVIIRNRIRIAKGITVGQGSNVVKDLTLINTTYVGNPCEQILC